MRWKRNGYGSLKLVDDAGKEVGCVCRMEYCRFWYPYLWGADEPDGIRFRTAWEAKAYVEQQVAKKR